MSYFDDASLVVIPSGYKTSKVYSVKPDDGSGDFTFARNSTATRVNSSGVIESVAVNVPRLDYAGNGCPSLLSEPQRTNLVFPSDAATTQTRTVTATGHTLSFYGTGSVTLSGVATGTLTGTGANTRVSLTFTPTAGSLTLTVSGTVTNWQLEAGGAATSLIPTTTAAVTRLKDDIVITGASALIGQTKGVVYFDIDFRTATADGIRAFFSLEGSVSSQFSGFSVNTTNSGNNVSFAGTNYALSAGRHKVACLYDSAANVSKLFVDGALRSTDTRSAFLATIDRVSIGSRVNPFSGFALDRQQNGGFNAFVLFPDTLTDAQCIELTTL